jgi:hypothetical protein
MENTIVGLYDDFQDVQNAVQELKENGISGEQISLIANDVNERLRGEAERSMRGTDPEPNSDVGSIAGFGVLMGGIAGFLVGLAALAIPGIGPVLAAGPMVAALGGAGIGAVTGGVLGALVDSGVSRGDADIYAEGVRRGGTLLTVYTSETEADRVAEILNRHNPVNIEERVNEWEGWQGLQEEQSEPQQIANEQPAADGPILHGTDYEAEGSQQPRRALPQDEQYLEQKRELEKSRARIYNNTNRH